MLQEESKEETPEIREGGGSLGWILAAVAFALILLVFWPTLKDTALICWNKDDYSHGLLLPFISAYLLYLRWDRIKAFLAQGISPQFSWSGCLLLLVGLLIALVGEAGNLLFVRWVALFPTVVGTLFLLFGTKFGLLVSPPLLLNYMARPLPHSVVPILFYPLQVQNAHISAAVLEWLGVPVHLLGNVIEIPGMRLLVEEACSGMRSVMALLTVALIVPAMVAIPHFAKVIIAVLSILIALLLNVVRVAMTGVLAHFVDPETATGFFHTFSGMITFIIGLIILYYVALAFNKLLAKSGGGEDAEK